MNWNQLPGREPSKRTAGNCPAFFAGKRVLVTGAAGCIGGALAKALALCDPAQLLLIDMWEQGIYELQRQFASTQPAGQFITVLGNICDKALLTDLFERYRPQIIFHAAAFKHVPLLEQNPFAAISNNSLGTADLARMADTHRCEQFILVSTDKAADPVSIMGASKRVAELALLQLATSGFASGSATRSKTRMTAVRLGNVLNSPGSIVPLFREQLAAGHPLTITHPDVERYFITLEEATTALLEAAIWNHESAIMVPRMAEPVRIVDLARFMFSAPKSGLRGPESAAPERSEAPEITYIGLRPGDKLKEVLIGSSEAWSDHPLSEGEDPPLRCIESRYASLEGTAEAIRELEQAVAHRDLLQLVRAIKSIVPEYQPSSVISDRLNASSPIPWEVSQ